MMHVDVTLCDTRIVACLEGESWNCQFHDVVSGKTETRTLTGTQLAAILYTAIDGEASPPNEVTAVAYAAVGDIKNPCRPIP